MLLLQPLNSRKESSQPRPFTARDAHLALCGQGKTTLPT
ncbi:hypothetical protein FHX63_002055 [Cupriavidus plantarum]|nr:hypothetical protein [Cupriavidus plantarum]